MLQPKISHLPTRKPHDLSTINKPILEILVCYGRYLTQQGFHDTYIMKVTGHSSSAMVVAYDETAQETNAPKKSSLFSLPGQKV